MMKNTKHILIGLLMILLPAFVVSYQNLDDSIMISIVVLIVGFFIFNMSVRKSLFFKKYFISKYNLITTNISHRETFDIPIDLMFEKAVEVIDHSKFTVVAKDEGKYEILAITKPTLLTWGENLYIDFKVSQEETIMTFCSSTFFQVYSWGKNEDNLTALLEEIEKSLTV